MYSKICLMHSALGQSNLVLFSDTFRVFSKGGRGENDDNRNEGGANIFSVPMFIIYFTHL